MVASPITPGPMPNMKQPIVAAASLLLTPSSKVKTWNLSQPPLVDVCPISTYEDKDGVPVLVYHQYSTQPDIFVPSHSRQTPLVTSLHLRTDGIKLLTIPFPCSRSCPASVIDYISSIVMLSDHLDRSLLPISVVLKAVGSEIVNAMLSCLRPRHQPPR
ncbi:hypothetical protein ONZ45_g14687 [Pleurotus djamor]|nr:hypothetical protein ONZ45_g14687 [Pleurotus djamor]